MCKQESWEAWRPGSWEAWKPGGEEVRKVRKIDGEKV